MKINLGTQPNNGDERTITKFLWFPKIALNPHNQKYELRWLSKETFTQVYIDNFGEGSGWNTILWGKK